METIKSWDSFNEEKGNKWIQDAIKHPGALRKSMKKDKDEKISSTEIESELSKLRRKDKDPKKPGTQLGKKDATKKRRLELAKTLRSLKEHEEQQNYMFFSNLQTIKRLIDELLEMDESEMDAMLNEHDWASEHIATAKDDIEEVFNFFKGHDNPEEDKDFDDEDFDDEDFDENDEYDRHLSSYDDFSGEEPDEDEDEDNE